MGEEIFFVKTIVLQLYNILFSAWSLLLYNGSTIAPADLSANITTPDTNHRAITNCTDFTYVDEPWYGGELVSVLKQISSAENGEIEDDTHDDDGVARSDATAGNASLPQRNARVCKRPRTSPLHVNLKGLCDKLYRAWDCLASHQTTISEEVGPTVRSTLSAILQAVSSKCRGIPCKPSDIFFIRISTIFEQKM
ncbi:hypothetical protein DPMN_098270 [Dreissena polymorpha]|uniref:Uncharacterized protein n=1 Tax=Dreissena polymorpha TaxID=45954 RepID=A0A9D4LCQ5_DREPO|nr:hypothetical protein DPMN_098270 [Dreissena polymorpha]